MCWRGQKRFWHEYRGGQVLECKVSQTLRPFVSSLRWFRFVLAFLVVRDWDLVKLVNDHPLLTEVRPVILVKARCLLEILFAHV